MKPFTLNILIILLVLIIASSNLSILIPFIVLGSSIWAYFDAKNLNIEKYQNSSLAISDKPIIISLFILLIWIISFPIYITWRHAIINGEIKINKEINTLNIINEYFNNFPQDRDNLLILQNQLKVPQNIFDRDNNMGHIVANALIINKDEVLLIFHNKLKKFIQPGGHVDPSDKSIIDATIREIKEETGLKNIMLDPWHKENKIPIFIETHQMPESKKEEKHLHHDFIYVFHTDTKKIELQISEVSDFKWEKINNILEKNPNSFVGKSLKRVNEIRN
jgi:8-oxo-dGTP pyrophosphatase MutT (NUDIX family)